MLRHNAKVAAVRDPPVSAVKGWVANRTFTDDRPLIDVSQAAPSYPPAAELREFIAELARRDDSAGYAPVFGIATTRASVATHFNAVYGASLDVDNVMITAGCNQAFCLAIGALCEPGDEVVLPVPFYFNHEMWLVASGIKPVTVPVGAGDAMCPDPVVVARSITPRTRAIVLVTPNNPCGVVYPPDLIESFFAMARQRGVALILDETYKDFRDTTAAPHRLFGEPEWDNTVVHLFSFSKVLSLAGYRVGSLVAAPSLLHEVAKLADCQTIGAPRISQEAVAWGLANLGGWREANRVDMLSRIAVFERELGAAKCGYEVVTAGSYFAYLRHPFGEEPSTSVARRLADVHDVLVIPGTCFGEGQEGFLRLAFGNIETAALATLTTRLAQSARSG